MCYILSDSFILLTTTWYTDIQPENATVAGKRFQGVSIWDCVGCAERETGQRLMASQGRIRLTYKVVTKLTVSGRTNLLMILYDWWWWLSWPKECMTKILSQYSSPVVSIASSFHCVYVGNIPMCIKRATRLLPENNVLMHPIWRQCTPPRTGSTIVLQTVHQINSIR